MSLVCTPTTSKGLSSGSVHCNRGPERHRSGAEAVPRIVIEGPSGTEHCNRGPEQHRGGTAHYRGPEAATRIAMEGPSGTEAAPRIVIEGPSEQIKLRLNEWPPFWGPFLDPKTGAVLWAKFQSRRKIARVSIVSARARQKFSMPLLFHGFAAPQALVLHTLRTFMATHVFPLIQNFDRPQNTKNGFTRVSLRALGRL